jgi:zinc transport system permease protein
MLGYAPILRGLIALGFAGIAFPLTGVLIVRMNLLTLRFALMHAALLGGAAGIAFGIHPTIATVLVSSLLVALMGHIARRSGAGLGPITTMIMAVTIAGAAALTYRFNVPARETLTILWGNMYALRPVDLWITIGFSLVLTAVVWINLRQLTAMMLDPEIAFLSGMNERALYYGVLFGVALTVGVAMRLVGALMLDVLLLLPALAAGQIARSVRGLFGGAMAIGVCSAVGGFFLSLVVDIPASAGVAAVGVAILAATRFVRHTLPR